jgi:type I restriction enzyme S subunit
VNEWLEMALGDLGRVVTGKTPSTSVPDYFGGDVPFVTPSDMYGHKVISRTARSLTKAGVAAVKGSFIPKGSVMVSCIGSDMGKVTIAAHDCVSNQQINSIVVSENFSADFIYYNLSTRKAELQSMACSGSAQPILNKGHFSQLPISLPPLSEQRTIASVLGSLDDKIELNRRMNETLEALAQSLFKSWFVDATQSALPKGWRESTIGEEVRVVGGSTPSTTKPEFWEGGTHHWATPKDLSNLNSPVLLETDRKITDAGIQQISSGLLPIGTVLLSSRAPIGYLVIAEVPVAVNQGFIGMICDGSLPNHYVRLWTKANKDAIEGRANGTTFMEISKTNFRPLPVIVPPPEVLAEFTKQVEPLHRRVVSNLKESRTLAALRDALLPKLLSGELRVPAAAKLMEATA